MGEAPVFFSYQLNPELIMKGLQMNQEQRNEMHNAMMEDFSDVIAKHFPNFDNNIEDQTWSFLVLFTEETIQQLGKENN